MPVGGVTSLENGWARGLHRRSDAGRIRADLFHPDHKDGKMHLVMG